MLVYWEQSVGGIQVENFDMEEEDANCEIQNHKCKVLKMKNKWKILWSTQIDF
jgi:hypothetical protein